MSCPSEHGRQLLKTWRSPYRKNVSSWVIHQRHIYTLDMVAEENIQAQLIDVAENVHFNRLIKNFGLPAI